MTTTDPLASAFENLLLARETTLSNLVKIENALTALGWDRAFIGPVFREPDVTPPAPDTLESERMSLEHTPRTRDSGAMGMLRALLDVNPWREWEATEACEALLADGWQTDSVTPRNVVGSSLAKLSRKGEVTKVRDGVYRSIHAPLEDGQAPYPAEDPIDSVDGWDHAAPAIATA